MSNIAVFMSNIEVRNNFYPLYLNSSNQKNEYINKIFKNIQVYE